MKLYLSSYGFGANLQALANLIGENKKVAIIPNALDFGVADRVAEAVMKAYKEDKKIDAPKHEL